MLATNRALIAAAAQVMGGLLAYNPRGHINLTDAQGATLYFCGLDLTPVGSLLLESVQGTNCTGLALAEDRLVYVLAEENFGSGLRQRGMHCAAAPIRDAEGRTLAMLTLTAEPGWFHFHTLGTVQAAAEAVSRQMALQALLEEQQAVLEVLNEGLVVLNEQGCIKALIVTPDSCFASGLMCWAVLFNSSVRASSLMEFCSVAGKGCVIWTAPLSCMTAVIWRVWFRSARWSRVA